VVSAQEGWKLRPRRATPRATEPKPSIHGRHLPALRLQQRGYAARASRCSAPTATKRIALAQLWLHALRHAHIAVSSSRCSKRRAILPASASPCDDCSPICRRRPRSRARYARHQASICAAVRFVHRRLQHFTCRLRACLPVPGSAHPWFRGNTPALPCARRRCRGGLSTSSGACGGMDSSSMAAHA